MNKYQIEGIGIFEEEGQDDRYYLGYTTRKDGKTHHIHLPFQKDGDGGLASIDRKWTVKSNNPHGKRSKEFVRFRSCIPRNILTIILGEGHKSTSSPTNF